MKALFKSRRGEASVSSLFLLFMVALAIAFTLAVFPVLVAKNELVTYANELCRTAQIHGRIGTETTEKAELLSRQTGIHPEIKWSRTGKIPLGEKFTLTLKDTRDIGFFTFGHFPVEITAKAAGISEVYWK